MDKIEIDRIARQTFLDFMELSDFPKNRVVIRSLDIAQMIIIGIERAFEKEIANKDRDLLLNFARYVNQNELSEADDKITDYSIKAFLKK